MSAITGANAKGDPVPIKALPQLPEYQYQFEPTDNEPPDTYNESIIPGQIEEVYAVADEATIEF